MGDSWRVQTLVKESEGRLSERLPSLPGEVILYAYTNNCRNIAKDLIAQCTPEQIASVPPKLLRWVAEKLDFQTAVDLVDKGVRPGDEVAGVLRTLTAQRQEWMAERLLERGLPVEPDNYAALFMPVSAIRRSEPPSSCWTGELIWSSTSCGRSIGPKAMGTRKPWRSWPRTGLNCRTVRSQRIRP